MAEHSQSSLQSDAKDNRYAAAYGPANLVGAGYADGAGDSAGDRQHHFYFHTGRKTPSGETGKGPVARLGTGDVYPHRPPVLSDLAHGADLATLLQCLGYGISGRDAILISGGLFLIWKSTIEIHEKLEGGEGKSSVRVEATFRSVIVQILLLDIIFSLDSIITALGMANQFIVMVVAVVLAVGFMMLFSGKISLFVEQHPTIKILALSFLILIGVALIGDGLDMHIPKGYIYFAMAFSVCVEMLNMRLHRRSAPVKLHQPYNHNADAKGVNGVNSG